MVINIVIMHHLGVFKSSEITIEYDDYQELIAVSDGFHLNGYNMALESGGHVIIPPGVIKESIMVINIIKHDE